MVRTIQAMISRLVLAVPLLAAFLALAFVAKPHILSSPTLIQLPVLLGLLIVSFLLVQTCRWYWGLVVYRVTLKPPTYSEMLAYLASLYHTSRLSDERLPELARLQKGRFVLPVEAYLEGTAQSDDPLVTEYADLIRACTVEGKRIDSEAVLRNDIKIRTTMKRLEALVASEVEAEQWNS